MSEEEIKNYMIPDEIKYICMECEDNIHKQEKGCAWRSLGNEYCDYVLNATKLYLDKDKEIERLNKLISQREKKWEKWTTEKQILSSKMSDYLCKYQNLKREYTKQIKISTNRKREIEKLNNIINAIDKYLTELVDDEIMECCNIYDINGIELRKYIKELKGSDKECI